MGVVRREGGWRLKKLEEGLYEITYEKEPRERIVTPEHVNNSLGGPGSFGLPVHRVNSYSEAEGLFEERAHTTSHSPNSTVLPADSTIASSGPNTEDLGSAEDLENLPPGGVALVLIAAGGIFLWTMGLDFGSPAFFLGSVMLVAGVAIIAWSFVVSDDASSALSLLVRVDNSNSGNNGNEAASKTPPTPEKLKNDLFFDRANQQCEWCGSHVDQPEVHHIVPRSEGGPNEPSNLIVLCPNDHRKADSGAISRAKLKAKVRRLDE